MLTANEKNKQSYGSQQAGRLHKISLARREDIAILPLTKDPSPRKVTHLWRSRWKSSAQSAKEVPDKTGDMPVSSSSGTPGAPPTSHNIWECTLSKRRTKVARAEVKSFEGVVPSSPTVQGTGIRLHNPYGHAWSTRAVRCYPSAEAQPSPNFPTLTC